MVQSLFHWVMARWKFHTRLRGVTAAVSLFVNRGTAMLSSLTQLYTYPCHSLTDYKEVLLFDIQTPSKSDPRDLWPLRHLIRVMRRHDMTIFFWQFWYFWQFWKLLTIFKNIDIYWPILTIIDNLDLLLFWQFWHF